MSEEEPQTKNTCEQDWQREPCTIEKPVECASIPSDHALDKVARVSFHPRALVAGFALAQNARTHQGGQRQRHKPRSKNGNNDRHRKLAEDAAEKSRNEDQRNENGGERKRHRENGEGNFAGAVECSL